MNTRGRLSIVLAALVIASASVGVSHMTVGPEWATSTTALLTDAKQPRPTSTPARPAAPSSVGDDLIYDFVGPNTTDGVTKVQGR
jgi:hypothetical protein